MSISDPIADMLTIIRNACMAKKEKVNIPASKLSEEILKVFKKEGYIQNYKFIEDNKQGMLRAYLKFTKGKDAAIIGLKRVSRPGLRIYAKKEKIPTVIGGLGVAVLSTSKGILTDKEAREKKIGGEVLCYIW